MEMSARGSGEIPKVKAEFQRELYKVGESRITNTDNQSNIIVAAAVTVVGLAAAASQDGFVNPWLFAAAGLAWPPRSQRYSRFTVDWTLRAGQLPVNSYYAVSEMTQLRQLVRSMAARPRQSMRRTISLSTLGTEWLYLRT
jgi:hypothetical protein